MKSNLINKLLYDARIKKGVSLTKAAIKLKVWSLQLKLIEQGYLRVPKKRRDDFIKYYDLEKDFFTSHSTYVQPLKTDDIDIVELEKEGKKLAKRRTRIISLITIIISLGCVAFGVYANNRRFITPKIAWTDKYTKFDKKMRESGERTLSILGGDYVYKIKKTIGPENNNEDIDYTIDSVISLFENEINADQTTLSFDLKSFKKVGEEYDVLSTCSFYYVASNKKKVVVYTYNNFVDKIVVPSANIIVESNNTLTFRPFDYYKDGKSKKANPGDEMYKYVSDYVSVHFVQCFINIDFIFMAENLIYTSALDLFEDVRKISRDNTLYARLGITFIPIFTFIAMVALLTLCLSYYCRYQLKHVNDYSEKTKEQKKILNYTYIPNRGKVNDIDYPLVIPESALRVAGLVILAISSIALFLTVYLLFENGLSGFNSVKPLRNISTNFLSSAILLLFFIKLDVFKRKNVNDLLSNIFTLFVFGFIFYIVELLLFNSLTRETNLFSTLLNGLASIMPGNVVWNIMLYSLIFYFLFTIPEKFKGDKTKIIIWRSLSLIPTGILIFALFYKFLIEKNLSQPIYISLLFHTSGINTTVFAILYLYSLYFFDLYNKLNYGYKVADLFSYSRRYNLFKNIMASSIIIILFIVDIFARTYFPNNVLKLGQNWSLICLIPIIMFYRPHIGARNKHWDRIYSILYGTFLAGGYVSIAIYVISKLDISEMIYIRF